MMFEKAACGFCFGKWRCAVIVWEIAVECGFPGQRDLPTLSAAAGKPSPLEGVLCGG